LYLNIVKRGVELKERYSVEEIFSEDYSTVVKDNIISNEYYLKKIGNLDVNDLKSVILLIKNEGKSVELYNVSIIM
jgi:hypothetical protein